jgi:hypothetical protein
VATFSTLRIGTVGTGYGLSATATGLTAAASSLFNVVDNLPPSVVSAPSASVTTATVGDPVQFTFVATDTQPITYRWDFGDGTVVETSATTVTHPYTTPNTFTITVTATDSGGLSTTPPSLSLLVVAAGTPPPGPGTTPGTICDGLNPIELKVQQVAARLVFPTSPSKDALSLKAIVQLSDGFSPAGQVVQWQLGDIRGETTLDAKGNSPKSATVKASLRWKKPKKGQPFTARPGKLSISLKSQVLSTFHLGGITTLNATSTNRKGDPATMDAYVVLKGHQAYAKTGMPGTYKATKDKGGSFKAKFKV